MAKETFYTIADVAKAFGSSDVYIRQMINKKELSFSKIGGKWIISHTDLMRDYENHKPIMLRNDRRKGIYSDKPLRV